MRYPKAETAEKHRRIVDRAAHLFRQKGFSAVSVGEVMKASGLTHGPFYNHFASKEALLIDSLDHASALALADIEKVEPTVEGKVAYLANYLSVGHLENPGDGCPIAALAVEIAREPNVQPSFTANLKANIAKLSAYFPWSKPQNARGDAIRMLSTMVGAMVLARAVSDRAFAEEILAEARKAFDAER